MKINTWATVYESSPQMLYCYFDPSNLYFSGVLWSIFHLSTFIINLFRSSSFKNHPQKNVICYAKWNSLKRKMFLERFFLILYAFERNICFEHPLNNLICYDLLMSLSRLSFDLRNVKTEVWKSKLEQHDKWKLGEIDQNYLSTHTWYRHKIRWNCTNKCFIIHFFKPTE